MGTTDEPMTMKILINGSHVEVTEEVVSYERLVELAGAKGTPSLTYRSPVRGDSRREGTMHTGQMIRLEDGMVISVIHTGNA